MHRLPPSVLVFALVAVWTVVGTPTPAQTPDDALSHDSRSRAQQAENRLRHAKQTHLWRIGAWGSANLLGGAALMWRSDRVRGSTSWHFGAMSAGWGLINGMIASIGLARAPAPITARPHVARARERRFHDLLLLNLGLNVGYAAVGLTMLGAARSGVSHADRWRGFGGALILQGMGLLILDGIAYLGSRSRLRALLHPSSSLSVTVTPTRLAITVPF